MRALLAIPAVVAASLTLAACGGGEGGGGTTGGDSDPLDESEIKIGDGIGTHAVSLELQIAEDLKRHIADGADPKKEYMIEYHLAADSLNTAREIVSWGEQNGFTPEFDESQVVKGEWIHVDLLKNSKLEVNPLWNDVKAITSLAESLMCEYEGWGFKETP